MKMTSRSKNAGFSLAELIGVVVILGILAGAAGLMISNASKQANLNAKLNNAAEATRVIQNIRAAGGETDTTAAAFNTIMTGTPTVSTIVGALKTGVTAGGMTFSLPNTMTAANYKLSGSGWSTIIENDPAAGKEAP